MSSFLCIYLFTHIYFFTNNKHHNRNNCSILPFRSRRTGIRIREPSTKNTIWIFCINPYTTYNFISRSKIQNWGKKWENYTIAYRNNKNNHKHPIQIFRYEWANISYKPFFGKFKLLSISIPMIHSIWKNHTSTVRKLVGEAEP